MSKRAKRWAALVATILLLPISALLAARATIDPDRFRPRIVALVAEQTGRTLSIDGRIRIEGGLLQPTLAIDGVRLSNLPGGSRPDMATVERIEATLSLPWLLRGQLRVGRLTLIGPNILFEPVDGQANWVFRGRNDAHAGTRAPASFGPSLWIAAAHVRNGMATFRFPARTNVIGLRSLDYAHDRWTDPLRLDAVLVYRDFQPFTAHLDAVPTGGMLDPWTTRFHAAAFDASVEADGSASLDGPFAVRMSLRAPELEQLNRLLPSMRLPALHGMTLDAALSSPRPGDLPVPGRTSLRVRSVDLGDRVPGLLLSDLRLDLPDAGGVASLSASGRSPSGRFALSASARMPARFDGRATSRVTLSAWPGTSPSPSPGVGAVGVGAVGVDAVGANAVRADAVGAGAAGANAARAGAAGADAVSVRGTLSLLDGAFDGFSGALSLRAASLAALRPIVGPALPGPSVLPALTALRMDATLLLPARLDRVALGPLSLRAAEGDLDGTLAVRLDGSRAAEARLHSDRLALDALLPASTASRAGAGAPFMTATLPWDRLRDGAFDLDWRADRIAYRGQDWPGLALHATLGDGALAVRLSGALLRGQATMAVPGTAPGATPGTAPTTASATAPGAKPGAAPGTAQAATLGAAPGGGPGTTRGTKPGTGPGTGPRTGPGTGPDAKPRAEPAGPTAPSATLAFDTGAFPLRPLAVLAGLPGPAADPVSGTLRLSLALSAHGATPAALVGSLDGSIALSTDGAALSDEALAVLAAPALKQLGARPSPGGRTVVRCLDLRGTAQDGLFRLSTLAVDAGSLVLSGVGEIDLAHDRLALKLHPLARLAGSRVAVPVVVDGPIEAPTARLDASGLDKVGLLLDALFGGDHPRTCAGATGTIPG